MEIISKDNQLVKKVAALKLKKGRQEHKMFIVEGYHLVNEAYATKNLAYILSTNQVTQNFPGILSYVVSQEIIKKVTYTITPQPIVGVCFIKEPKIDNPKKILMIDDISDPGNLGTIVRTACALGIDLILASFDTVDLYNDKTVRASQGAVFKIPFMYTNLEDAIINYRRQNCSIYATTLEGGNDINNVKKSECFAIIVGNEARGVAPSLVSLADEKITIQMKNLIESLNVSVATAIVLYEFLK